jgi:porin
MGVTLRAWLDKAHPRERENRGTLGLIRGLCPALALLTLAALVQPAAAQENEPQGAADEDTPSVQNGATSCDQPPPQGTAAAREGAARAGCGLLTRSTLTGDWYGYRSRLEEFGIKFSGRVTQFAFAISGGINNTRVPPGLGQGSTSAYTGRGEYDVLVDLEKFGSLPKGTLLIRAEHWYGKYGNVSTNTGSFAPSVFGAALPPAPNDPGTPFLTGFLFTQPLSKNLVVYAGKKDVLGSFDQDYFAGGDGTGQFVNQAFVANPAFLLGLPYTSYTAGVVVPTEWGVLKAFVYDPKDRTTETLRVDDLFSKGVIVGGEVKVKSNFFGLPGEQHVGGVWKHHQLTNLSFNEPPPGVYPEPTVPGSPTLWNSHTIYTGFDQFLKTFKEDQRRGWGLFGRASLSDGNPTPVRYFVSAGLGGDSLLRSGRNDTWGIAWYYVGASTEFGVVPRAVFDPHDGTGVEAFYNIQVTPWLTVTPDVQYIQPGMRRLATHDAYIGGFRINVIL